ncbi:aminopeptidase N isoform X2 [Cryptotermes secundus]|nr:aminopeptidase N isoform X2 [Cryptotermes secundus]XP_023722518.1 aminopeptidase N isoform X2 [Cryptotermes secundus]
MPREDDDDETYYNFEITPVMSTYLIAFIVSDFTVLRNEPENFGVWARKGAIEQAEYSRDVGPKLLHAIEGFLDVKYPLPKLDVVAVPDFSSGAMENWGLTTYRERIVLYDEDHATAATKQQIATVVAHEFAHQWFGDLVSPEWWNYLWLNEGFATYFESFATDLVETEWRLQEQFVVRDLQSALAADALLTTHPITQPVDSPNSIRAIFDTISYEKAGSVIRMMEHFVTTEVFKKGLKRYLVARDHLDANENHLYEAINAELLETKPGSHENVADILHTWTQQAGYPLVTITSEDSGLTITQERFLLTRASTRNEGSTLWSVPLTYAVQDGDFTDTSTKEWLTESSLKIGRPTEEDKWFIFNVQQIGFYRVNYDEHNWNLLTNYLKSEDYEKIPPVNRAQILDDALNLARAGILEYSTALELTQYLEEEVDYIPWYSALNAFSFLNLRLAGTSTHPLFKEYILKLIQHVYEDLTYEESDADDHVTKLLRSSILQWACNLDHEDCVEKAKGKFHALHEGSSIKPNLQSVTYCTALRHGGEEEWNLLWDKYVKSNFATEQSLILGVLGCTAHQELINEYLKKSITDNGDIRRQDAASVFSAVYSNPQGFQFAFDFLRNSYGDIVNFYGTGVASVLTGIAARITTQEQLTEFENFIEHNELGAATEAARRAVESAKENLAWVEKYESEINSWLVSLTTVEPTEPPTASPPTETPTASPPTEPPTASPPTETPTASPPTEPPTESPPTEPPTASPPTEPPTAAPPTPTEAATPSTTGEASSVSLSPVLCITLFCTILYQIVTVFKVK